MLFPRPIRLTATDLDHHDNRIATLGRGLGALRLALGEGLLRLSTGDIQELGFPTFESYVREALGHTGRWGADVRALARRLRDLPRLRTALASGRLSLSVVELVARLATPDDEAEWVGRVTTAPGLNVRQLRAEFKERKLEVRDDTLAPRVSIAMTVDKVDAWAFAQARIVPPASLVVTWPDADDPTAPAQIDRQLRSLAATLAMRDIELGELACAIVDHEAWRAFGYASFDHCCRERIGLGPSSVATRVALTRRFGNVPEVRTALAACRIAYESAALIARVGGPNNVHAWIERATQRTVKQLHGDVDVIELLACLEGRSPCTFTPPDDDTRDAVDDVERSVIAAITGLTETPPSQTSGDLSAPTPEAGPTTLHLSLTESTGRLMASRGQRATRRVGSSSTHRTSPGGALTFALGFWRALDRLHGQVSGGAPFVPFLVRAVLDTWRDTTAGQVAYADVYLRDRWRCTSPVCGSRNVTPRHIRFRSHGGGKERTNLISLCERCHLEFVLGDKLRICGHAPHGLT